MGDLLKDRVAIVTGAVGGIGRELSCHLAQEGATIALNYLVEPEKVAEAFFKEFTQQGYRGKLFKGDISRPDEATQLAENVIKEFGRIDILVNNAGITIDKSFKNMTAEQWEKVIAVDLSSVFHCSKAVIGQMHYAAAKAGIIGFTKALALEMAKKGITVNAVAPGFVKTAMTDLIPKDVLDKIIDTIPMGRMAEPSEVARVVQFLADERSSYISGQVIAVNGGLYM